MCVTVCVCVCLRACMCVLDGVVSLVFASNSTAVVVVLSVHSNAFFGLIILWYYTGRQALVKNR